MRRKKKEESETYYARFDDPFALPEFNLHSRLMRPPTSIETVSINDSMRQYITATYPSTTYPSTSVPYWEPYTTTLGYEDFAKNREEEAEMNIISDKPFKGHYVVRCTDIVDLSVGRILKTLSAMKGKLMLDTAPVQIQNIDCFMTPIVRKHIIMASKKLKMYGKNPPIIARFDEFGNRLPDEIELDFKKRSVVKYCES